jgi:predicted acylesterase/phospholipase RssA
MTTYPLNPTPECDVLMKGGITSGVIYPHAVCELALTYRLRAIGGSSAGAIAAAAAAAAELGRANGGFDRLERLPDNLTKELPGGNSVLFRLFQPQRPTNALFRLVTASIGHRGFARWARTGWSALTGFVLWAFCGALPGAALLALGLVGTGPEAWAAAIGGVLALVVGATVGIALGVLRGLARGVPANGFGLCSGMPGTRSRGAEALTPWLHKTLQDLAGRPDTGPLTFADLEGARVELRMMTTNLTRHQPTQMPWPGREYFFDPDQFRGLFPADVLNWMSDPDHAPKVTGSDAERRQTQLLREQARPLLPFPAPEHLPVVVATRMSLSFPLLISAVPLYAVNYSAAANRDARAAARRWLADHPEEPLAEALGILPRPAFEVNWFSDGGISSNLPVHFFDTPLPMRPTFAVDLAPFPQDHRKSDHEPDNSHLPTVNQGGLHRRWTTWDDRGLGSVAAFGRSIVDTARSWVDESQLVMPGYRDRIVTIYHDKNEGGMNLNMKRDVVENLVRRGRGGAARLVDRFANGDGWDNHRWIRFRTASAGLDVWLSGFRRGYTTVPNDASTPYADLAGPNAAAQLPSYNIQGAQRKALNCRTGDLVTLAEEWRTAPADAFTEGSPAPRPVLRLVPGGALDRPDRSSDAATDAPADEQSLGDV